MFISIIATHCHYYTSIFILPRPSHCFRRAQFDGWKMNVEVKRKQISRYLPHAYVLVSPITEWFLRTYHIHLLLMRHGAHGRPSRVYIIIFTINNNIDWTIPFLFRLRMCEYFIIIILTHEGFAAALIPLTPFRSKIEPVWNSFGRLWVRDMVCAGDFEWPPMKWAQWR